MIFELNHESITIALREYMDRRNILGGREFTFQMKTSRKGAKTSRVIITTVDVVVAEEDVEPVVEAMVSPQKELPLDSVASEPQVEEEVKTEEENVVGEVKATPFKKLFAA